MTMYEITGDMRALKALVDSLEDEDGNPMDLTDEEKKTTHEWYGSSITAF
jgi:hypothetical protein